MEASDSITNRGVSLLSLSHVIFSFGTAPESVAHAIAFDLDTVRTVWMR